MKKTVLLDPDSLNLRLNRLKIDSLTWQFTYNPQEEILTVSIEGNKKDFPDNDTITRTVLEYNAIWEGLVRNTTALINAGVANTNSLGSKITTSAGMISLIQIGNQDNNFNVNVLYPSYNSAPTAGNLLVLALGANSSGVQTSISNIVQVGVSWSRLKQTHYGAGNESIDLWVGVVGSGADTNITVNLASTPSACLAQCAEFSLNYGGLDLTASNNNFNAQTDSGTTGVTAQNKELIIAAICTSAAQSAPTNSFIMLDGAIYGFFNLSVAICYKIQSVTAAQNTGTTQTAGGYAGVIATLKAS